MTLRKVGIAITSKAPVSRLNAHRLLVRCHGQPNSAQLLRPAVQLIIKSHERAKVNSNHWLIKPFSQRSQSYDSRSAARATNISILENEAIKSFKVYVINQDNKLSEPLLLFDALAARGKDEKGKFTEVLRQVQPASPSTMFPVCKYFTLKSLREKELAQQKLERAEQAAKRQTKQLELNWTIGENDLAHRMERLKEFLSKGRSVEVTLGTQRKKGWQKRKPQSTESAKILIDRVREAALEVKGAKESTAMTGEMSELVVLHFEGPRKAKETAPG